VGDLPGIRAHLDDLAWLGVDALWISPFYPSPMVDFGYDVSDYCDVDPTFGSLEDFDRLIEEAHARNIRVIIDWVPNHTSDRHPWFLDARSGRDSTHRRWYVWRDAAPDGSPPNNWMSAFDIRAPAWTFDEPSGQWYLHLFESAQPDLNWDEPAVEEAMHAVLRFWLDRGVDGFRADVVHCIGKDPALPDDPEPVAGLPHCVLNDVPVTHQRLRRIRALLDGYAADPVVVGEVYLLSTATVATYYGAGDELQLAFNFPPLLAGWEQPAWSECIAETVSALEPRGAWPTWVLSNHDNPRHRTRYDRAVDHPGDGVDDRARRSEARARAAAVLLLTLRGTPFLYQGEELGLVDAVVPEDRRVDPGGRDGCRAPIPWSGDPDHGWPTPEGL
jgi:alpha-glucosidase